MVALLEQGGGNPSSVQFAECWCPQGRPRKIETSSGDTRSWSASMLYSLGSQMRLSTAQVSIMRINATNACSDCSTCRSGTYIFAELLLLLLEVEILVLGTVFLDC